MSDLEKSNEVCELEIHVKKIKIKYALIHLILISLYS